ncbi:superoxide dismutase family protein [Paenibacillus koleovorans]|uniref:superoxide dismutase family protein n=1 Tax=Paenibacillus koleovorans TaxID=121608 RepID=UPI000FDB2034|nr:superoxide dismutase family protein [Paenibacillus koleovorans]
MKRVLLYGTMLLALTACSKAAPTSASLETEPPKPTGAAMSISIINGSGTAIGAAKLTPVVHGIVFDVEVSGLTPGEHGIHIHDTGKCETPDFKSAGAHFNPGGKQHGYANPQGFHAGDFPNLTVGADGKAKAQLFQANVTLEKGKPSSLLKEGGTALVIHDKPDDLKTDPSGNSGDRLACGPIK